MISIRIDLSTPKAFPAVGFPAGDPVMNVAAWLAMIMNNQPIEGMVIHNVTVEQGDL